MRRAGIALAREVERRAPDAVTTSWWKEERGKRIFIDFNQNARDRTFASAYSVRRTQIATVSMPLTWDELATAEPDNYTMAPWRIWWPAATTHGLTWTRLISRFRRCSRWSRPTNARTRRSALSTELSEDAGRTQTGPTLA